MKFNAILLSDIFESLWYLTGESYFSEGFSTMFYERKQMGKYRFFLNFQLTLIIGVKIKRTNSVGLVRCTALCCTACIGLNSSE